MTRITGGAFVTIFVVFTSSVGSCAPEREADSAATTSADATRSPADADGSLLYGRVTTGDGDVYEGRLRFGGDEEALWGNYFNGYKDGNPWVAHAPVDRLPREDRSFKVFGIELGMKPRLDLGRPFMARFGDIARIEASGRDLWVTLKSGTVVQLDRYAADDFADGVRVWDASRGVVDLRERRVRSIELLSNEGRGAGLSPLHGTVHTPQGDFSGLVQWDREACFGADALQGRSAHGEVSLRFDSIRSIARRSGEGALVTLLDGEEVVLSNTRQDGRGNRGMYVDDPRYGRVLISWDAFERIDLSPGTTGPAYDDFRPGQPLTGTVVTRSGRRLTGRLVYDLDESETTETLDAPSQGVDYTLPFELIASIEPLGEGGAEGARVILHSGGELQLEPTGDLAERNAGMLIFSDGGQSPDYVPWADVEKVDFGGRPEM